MLKEKLLKNKINDNFIIFSYNEINTYELIAMSDMVISCPHSSIVDESLSSNIKTYIYDPSNTYSSKNFWYNRINSLRINKKKNLIKKIELLQNNELTNKNNFKYAKIMNINLNYNYLEKVVRAFE